MLRAPSQAFLERRLTAASAEPATIMNEPRSTIGATDLVPVAGKTSADGAAPLTAATALGGAAGARLATCTVVVVSGATVVVVSTDAGLTSAIVASVVDVVVAAAVVVGASVEGGCVSSAWQAYSTPERVASPSGVAPSTTTTQLWSAVWDHGNHCENVSPKAVSNTTVLSIVTVSLFGVPGPGYDVMSTDNPSHESDAVGWCA